ncbi:MAG TPA: nitroreductase [Thermoanaerobaculia bacterium]|nr:nitroreductase [Thermoanaerobaculia bacterium]
MNGMAGSSVVERTAPWEVAEAEFPWTGRTAERLAFCVRYAVLAPSGHNTQPWRFKIERDVVELWADRSRALPVVDPEGRELAISCGAALYHLRLAVRHYGHVGEVEILPDPKKPDLFARIRLGQLYEIPDAEELLFRMIPRRRTNRQPFAEKAVPDTLLSALRMAASQERAWLYIVDDSRERQVLTDLITEGDRLLWHDPDFRRELAEWTRTNRTRSHDGIPGHALGMNGLASYAGPLVMRTFDLGEKQAEKDRLLVEGAPVLAVLGTGEDTPASWLAAGQALARVLLRARVERVWASFQNQPVEVPGLRSQVPGLIGRTGFPQMILRLGYGPEPEPTPRRGAGEVVVN